MPPDQASTNETFLDRAKAAACLPVNFLWFVDRTVSWRDLWRDFFLTTVVFAVLAIFDPIGVASNSALSSEQLLGLSQITRTNTL